MQALCDGGGIDEEAAAQGTADIWVELVEGELGLAERKQITVSVYRYKIAIQVDLNHMDSGLPEKIQIKTLMKKAICIRGCLSPESRTAQTCRTRKGRR